MPNSGARRPLKSGQDDRIAVIDIGSNSVRMVIYDRLDRTPLPIFNEKQMCGLGRGLAATGRLNKDGKEASRVALNRFALLIERLGIKRVIAAGTAALREAEDGPDFVAQLERETNLDIEVISGAEEARLSASGVIAGLPQAKGVMGDLGGGSLELVAIDKQQHGDQESLPLGPFKFPEKLKDRDDAVAYIRDQYESLGWLSKHKGQRIYPVGGAWRAIAKLHMGQSEHRLHIIHAYEIRREEALDFTDLISRQSRSSLEKMGSISSRRIDVIPHAALLMNVLIEVMEPEAVMFSSYGLREGLLFDRLDAKMRAEDPLLYSCRAIEARNSNFDGAGPLFRWTAPLFPKEDPPHERLRRACCLLSDFCWAEHPDYRAEHAFLRVLRSTMVGITHAERVFLATVLHRRYGGKFGAHAVASHVLDDKEMHLAEVLGNALRLAQTLAGGAEALLEHTKLEVGSKELTLHVDPGHLPLINDLIERRLSAVAKVLDLSPVVSPNRDAAA
ncbi:MAG: Ppx/GppA family phosphatase [Alphaproteobacteria bacterium]|nr:Ppx/GppA family phosphatase [Alphaproteobacteria bacterium SS10]